MQVGLHQFHADTIAWLSGAVLEEGRTRSSLARDLCALEDWTGARGEPCLASARKTLPVLADRLGLALPAARVAFGRGRCGDAPVEAFPDLSLRCRLADLGTVTLELVDGEADRRLWEAMMVTHHPQGWARAPGGQLRYWVCSSLHGRLGGIGFGAASWHQRARDEFIGWSTDARIANLSLLINNHRFLLLPGVRVHGLASRVLALAAGRVAADWEARLQDAPCHGLQLCRPRACRHLLPGGGLAVLFRAHLRPAAGVRRRGGAHGVDEAAGGGLAGGVVRRAGARYPCRAGAAHGRGHRLGGTGICAQHAS